MKIERRDVISHALKRGWYKTKNRKIRKQNWQDLKKEVSGKKLFVFGCGDGAEYFCQRYFNCFTIEGFLDNDKTKQGMYLSDCIFMKEEERIKQYRILGLEEFEKYEEKEIVVLITSLKYYELIIEQLEQKGIHNYFVLLHLEKGKRFIETEEDKYWDFEKMPINNKKIIVHTMGGYSGHGKAIIEELLKHRKDLDIVWVVNDMTLKVPEGIRLVFKKNRSKYFYEMSTAKYWLDDYLVSLNIQKRSEQIYIQIKHWSSITLKSFGFGLYEFRNDKVCLDICKHNSSIIDYILVGSKFDEETCKKGFGVDGQFVYVGSPRSDILFRQKEVKSKFYHMYNIKKECKLALFAPTFRCGKGEKKSFEVGDMELDFERLKTSLEKKFGGEWKILLRLHPNVAEKSNLIQKEEYVIDVSMYSDSEELVAASDVMITDYSSIMFEPAFVYKPVFLFAPDKKNYINGERELLIDYDSLPFPMAESNEELFECIAEYEKNMYEKDIKIFMDKYGVDEDGHASERAAQFINNLLEKGR